MVDVFVRHPLCVEGAPVRPRAHMMPKSSDLVPFILLLHCVIMNLAWPHDWLRSHRVDPPFVWPRRDLVHRQTASAVVQHMSLGVYGFGCEDSLNHLLNYVWPNVFETSPHVIQAVMGALEGLRVAIGPCRMLQYCLQVRTVSQSFSYFHNVPVIHILATTYISHWIPMHIHPMIRDVNLWCTVLLQGLFHPARKVRDVYWKIYNSIYIGSQDALIAHYPQVYNDEKNVYVRYELEYVL